MEKIPLTSKTTNDMTTAELLKAEMTARFPMEKSKFFAIVCDKIRWYGYASFICAHHITETDRIGIRLGDEQAAIAIAASEGFKHHYDTNAYGVRRIVFTL